jgi:hypothetical protein
MGLFNATTRGLLRFSPVPVDPLRHEFLVAEAFLRNSAAHDPGEAFGKRDLSGRRQPIMDRKRCQSLLAIGVVA